MIRTLTNALRAVLFLVGTIAALYAGIAIIVTVFGDSGALMGFAGVTFAVIFAVTVEALRTRTRA